MSPAEPETVSPADGAGDTAISSKNNVEKSFMGASLVVER
jgi:hypothetical protein